MASARKTATNENVSTYGNATRNYTSMVTWEADTDIDLVTATQSEVLECYDDADSFDDYCPLLGATTNSSYFRIVRPASGQGHDGTPNNGFNIANTANVVCFSLYEDYSQVQDIVAKSTLTASINRSVFQSTKSNCAFVGCIAYDSVLTAASANFYGFFASPDGASSDKAFFIDCIAINITTTGTGVGNGFQDDDDGVINWYNCTAVNNQNYGFSQGSATCNAKNCCSSGNTVADWTGTITKTTCTAEGATPTYVNAAGNDFHLAAGDTVCRGNGTDLSADANYPFNDDIDGDTRSAWDIGFDEYVAAGVLKINNETVGAADSFYKVLIINKIIAEAVSASETIVKTLNLLKIKTEGATAYDEQIKKLNVIKVLVDVAGALDTFFDVVGVVKAHNESVSARDQRFVSNGSAFDIDCTDISGWTDGDTGEAVSSQVTFDSKSCFKFDTVTSADTDDRAQRNIDFGSVEAIGNRIVASVSFYHDAIGTSANSDYFLFSLERSDWKFDTRFASDGLFIRNSSAFVEVGTNLVVQDVWQEWTFDIDLSAGVANATVDVYLNNVLKASDFSCNRTGSYTDGQIIHIQYGYITNSRISYVDWVKIGNDFAQSKRLSITKVYSEIADVIDALVKAINITKIKSETGSASEEINKAIALVKLLSETAGAIDEVNKIFGFIKIQSESVSASDALIKLLSIVKEQPESAGATETLDKKIDITKVLQESVGVIDALNKKLSIIKAFSESSVAGDVSVYLINLENLIKVYNETVGVVDGLVKSLIINKVIDEAVSAVEAANKALNIIKIFPESASASDGINKIIGIVKSLAEAATGLDTAVSTLGIVRTRDEVVSASEAFAKTLGVVSVYNEAVTAGDVVAQRLAITKIQQEAVAALDVLNKNLYVLKIYDESVSANDTNIDITGIVKTYSEIVTATEALIKRLAISKINNEIVEAVETKPKKIGIIKSIIESVSAAESFVKSLFITKTVSETVTAGDTEGSYKGIVKIFNEVVSAVESFIKKLAAGVLGWREIIELKSVMTTVVELESVMTTDVELKSVMTTVVELESKFND